MNEHPILFSGPMVRAILEGRKTQTRRVIKPQPIFEGKRTFGDAWAWRHGKDWFSGVTTEQLVGKFGLLYAGPHNPCRCPYGQPGDLLWVRESWGTDDNVVPYFFYRADGEAPNPKYRWHPSIHMRRSDSRLTLRITDVRVQRVREITESDAKAEGMQLHPRLGYPTMDWYRTQFETLWNAINAKRGYAFELNPWVWALTFERVR